MRHPTILFFWGLVAAMFLWASAAAFVPHPGRFAGPHRGMGADSLVAGRGAWRPMHGWGGDMYMLSPAGGPPQLADVERALSDWVALQGNSRLKPGPVTEKDSNTFQADIVTKDGSLVQRFIIDRSNGKLAPVED